MAIIRLLFTALLLLPFFLFFSSGAKPQTAADTLSRGQSLSGEQTLVSKGGSFEFGFFSPGNSHKYYVGIWYKKVSKQTVAWVANREKPVSNASASELKLSEDGGNLVLADSKNQIWSSNSTSTASNSTIAVLLDSGNLVLKDEFGSHIFWQSFDHPTNAWFPGAKLGYDKLNKVDRLLTSWRNSEDPSAGPYSVEISPNGITQLYFLVNRTRQYFTTGVWDGRIFSAIPEMRAINSTFDLVAGKNVNYFSYNVPDASSIANYMLDFTGRIIWQQWDPPTEKWVMYCSLPRDPCDVYALCGSFSSCRNYSSPSCECLQGFEPLSMEEWNLGDHTRGCARKTSLRCDGNDGFVKLSDVQLPANPESLAANSTEECESTCLNNCSCVAYAYDTECLMWNGGFLGLKKLPVGSNNDEMLGVLYLRLAASELVRPKSEKARTVALISSVAGLVLITSLVSVLIWRFWRKPAFGVPEAARGFLVPFDYKDIKRATKDFSEKLGQGSFGAVFKGILPDSTVIAVKKLEGVRQGEKQFRMEVSTIGMIHHVNLVRLLGFCSNGDRRLLVYDYIPRGSLDSCLFGSSSEILNWNQRYQVALGTARGLAYLHEKCRECIMHCDIKPENILLDMNMCPKIADFGMAKLLSHEFSRVLTSMRGTFGYLAPEWLTGSAITPKADVYSYGMMLLEIISGRRNTDRTEDGVFVYFPLWAAIKVNERDVLCILDQKLEGDANAEELSRACKIACWCIQDQETSRPTMGHVVHQLEGVLDMGMPPIPRLLQKLAADGFISTLSESTGEFYSAQV
ncbi:G-type lectin S-receptor-like serine/threonine-protein kinase At2g19130 [Phoenix dactylifera]|uniref:Receptor-like serine/threonine-protein kinase n=1 Tax=Phoenix dactylifera TaxID=42345 RepID=A0A8B7BFA1_PHODC|nr:G-type lectin S-receptor-like serine/threonine-protein kinase At2g19130 [Phoenix dactylifera]